MTIIKQFETQEKPKYSKKYIFIVSIGLVSLIVMQIWANNTVASFGNKFEKVSDLQQNLILENKILENDIARYSALNYVASQSAILGFTKPKSVEYLR